VKERDAVGKTAGGSCWYEGMEGSIEEAARSDGMPAGMPPGMPGWRKAGYGGGVGWVGGRAARGWGDG